MDIGSIRLTNNLFLAPMAGVTDRPFRQLCRKLGAGMAVSEMISADTTLWGSRKSLNRLNFKGEPGPISVQIVGTDPQKMALAARRNIELGAQIIDINMGCPAKKVCKVAAGSALLRDEKQVARILEAVVSAVTAPVTLKIRTGWSPEEKNAQTIARIAEQSGIQMLAIHGRTRACNFSGNAEYETIRKVKQEVKIPVIANGDIDSPEKAKQVFTQTGVDGIMIGRAAQGRPWIFREIAHHLETGSIPAEPAPQWVCETLKGHLQALYSFYGELHGVRIARKHIAWYSRSQPGSAGFRERINSVDTAEEQLSLIDHYFDQLIIKKGIAA